MKTAGLESELKDITEAIFKECTDDPEILSIAINTDLRAKQLFILKWLLEKRLQGINIHITYYPYQSNNTADRPKANSKCIAPQNQTRRSLWNSTNDQYHGKSIFMAIND